MSQSRKCANFWLSSLCLFFIVSCVNIKPSLKDETPKQEIVDKVASWDENSQNSGVINFIPEEGWLITPHAANRYISLSEKFGGMFTPKLLTGEGLVEKGDNFILPQSYMVKFAVMNRENKKS